MRPSAPPGEQTARAPPTSPRDPHSTVNESFPIGRPFGIQVRVHALFLYMAGLLILLSDSPLGTLLMLVTLFGLVLLHELGHSLVARHHGIRVIDIVLWPLGGMARMSEIPESPRVEGQVAIAGPLVNMGLALIGILLQQISGFLSPTSPLDLNTLQAGQASFLQVFIVMNLMLGGFNLVPAFPMDGGRILRAFLARSRDYVQATEIAVRVGRYIALAMIFSVLIPPVNCALPVVGLYILWTGMKELWGVRLRHGAGTGGAAGPFGPGGGAFAFDLGKHMRGFAGTPPRHSTGPDQAGGPSDYGGHSPHSAEPSPRNQTGFSDDDLRRLEQDHGPLRRPPRE